MGEHVAFLPGVNLRTLGMPELRKDPIVGRWVIIATERAKRPLLPRPEKPPAPLAGTLCPFCEGNEDKTPGEILAYRDRHSRANERGWRVRVVPNKFPALQVEGSLAKHGEGMYDRMNGVGAHEVIIEAPEHKESLTEIDDANVRDMLWVYRDRLVDLKRDGRLVFGMLFKNVGTAAGASLEHTHSQLIVTPVLPVSVIEEMQGARAYYGYRGRCLFCDMIHQELDSGKRLAGESTHFVALCPYASRFPFEVMILPKNHCSHFENITRAEVDDLGTFLKQVLAKIEAALDKPAYNYVVHTAPFDAAPLPEYHWHIEIIPRLTRVAGFEWGTGFYINPVPPEQATEILQETEIESR
ncbi:MAG TPA: galactose-1-phosphate uridylyltransferase [Gemmatales bacterium]|nr:galactose-1-phosphate uridylyltransferase [Gemmatales bacterium]